MKRILLAVAVTLLAAPLVHAQSAAIILPSPVPAVTHLCVWQYNETTGLAECNSLAAASQPLTDAVGLMADDATPTKILALQLSGLSAGTKTWTVPDLSGTVAISGAAQNVTFGTITAAGLITANGGLAGTTGTFSSTLGVTGATTLSSTLDVSGLISADGGLAATTGTFSSTLGVTGATTLAALTASGLITANGGLSGTTGTFSSTLAVTGATTLTSTLGVTGKVQLGLAGSLNAYLNAAHSMIFNVDSDATGTGDAFIWSHSTTGDNPPVMQLTEAGVLTLANLVTGSLTSASGVITSSSDERLKDITGPLGYGLAEIRQVRPIRYRWNEASGIPTEPEYGGFGAAQVERWMPLAVSYGTDGFRGLNTTVILGAVVTAAQELDVRLAAVEARLSIAPPATPPVSEAQAMTEITARKAAEQSVRAARAACQASNIEIVKQGGTPAVCK